MKKYKQYIFALTLGASLVIPAVGFAQPVPKPDLGVGSNDPRQTGTFQLVSCDGVQKYQRNADGSIKYNGTTPVLDQNSKECDYNQLIYTIGRIVQFALYIITPIVLGMLLFAGFKYLTANGNPSKIADAKKMFMPIAIGVFFILGAYLIVYKFILQNLLVASPETPSSGGIDKATIMGTGGNLPSNN